MLRRKATNNRSILLVAMLLGTLALGAAGCAASLGDPNGNSDGTSDPSDPSNPTDPTDPTEPTQPDPMLCVGDGGSGETCEVTDDCAAPLVCLDGQCVGPQNPSFRCDPVEGIHCPESNQVCVAGACVINPGSCDTVDDCPNGFLCESGTCVPDRDGESCADPGPGPNLSGTWDVNSSLHLREGLPGVVGGLLDVSELLADFIDGNVNLGLPSAVEFLIGALVQGIIDQYVPSWAQDLIVALAGISDVLDTMQVEGTWALQGSVCEANYRGSSTWDYLSFEYRGTVIRERPQDISEVGPITPEDFGARYSCGDLYVDRHRVSNSLSGLVRWLVNTVVEIATGYPTVEAALDAALPCDQIAAAINNAWQSACGCSSDVSVVVEATCESYKSDLIDQVVTAIDGAVVTLSVLTLKGVGNVQDANTLTSGVWYGSVIGGDFPGTFSAVRR